MASARSALARLDEITRTYLGEIVAHANEEPSCDGRCLAVLLSEGLARSSTEAQVEKHLQDMRDGKPYKYRWGTLPKVPGWRGGIQGPIEPLVSFGKTNDGRFALEGGVIHLPKDESLFRRVGFLDSPGSYIEIGSVLPVELSRNGQRAVYVIGSDKFGHFLGLGYEMLETYLETRDEALAAGLKENVATGQGHMAALYRGLVMEVTSLGGWTSRVFSYGDLSANYAGFRFFKDVAEEKSPYFTKDPRSGKWALGAQEFSWSKLLEPSFDEGINCSHYYRSLGGAPNFQHKVAETIVNLQNATGMDLTCPLVTDACVQVAKDYDAQFGAATTDALVSPQCLEVARGGRSKRALSEADLNQSEAHYNEIGFYAGGTINDRSKAWCVAQRDALVAVRCQDHGEYASVAECVQRIERVGVEKFRCQLDTKDFAGWAF
jgi:hypothetical protein